LSKMLYKIGDMVKHFEDKNVYGLVTQIEKTSPKTQFCTLFCFYDGDTYSISNSALQPMKLEESNENLR
jgi:hypothetical protein